jgi:hypothetical protein
MHGTAALPEAQKDQGNVAKTVVKLLRLKSGDRRKG